VSEFRVEACVSADPASIGGPSAGDVSPAAGQLTRDGASVIRMPGLFEGERDAEEVAVPGEIPGDPETRRWLARELHDTVGTTLAGMLLEMEGLKHRGDESGLRTEIEGLQGSTREVLDSLRRLLSGLRDEPTHVTGFADRVFQVLERFERQTGIQTMLEADGSWPPRMAGRTAHHLLRIVDEALQNVRRHSYARSVEITLERIGDDAVLTIQDDGRGLQALPDGQGYGLTGMHEYAVLAGGELRIESFPDRGTAVKISVPLGRSR
jgi:two-component system, NarL family, sensor histidine kinase UhpB